MGRAGVTKAQPLWPEVQTRQGTGYWENHGEGKQGHRVVYEVLGSHLYCTEMDLILVSLSKTLRTELTDTPPPGSQSGHWVACMWDRSEKHCEVFENRTDIEITIFRSWLEVEA